MLDTAELGSDKLLRPVQIWKRYGIGASTLRSWDAAGRLKPAMRTLGGHRRYRASDVSAALAVAALAVAALAVAS